MVNKYFSLHFVIYIYFFMNHWSFIILWKLILLLIQIVFGFPWIYIFYYQRRDSQILYIKNLLDLTKILHQTFYCCTLGDLFEVVLSSYIRILKYGLILFLCIYMIFMPESRNPFAAEQQFRYFVFLSYFLYSCGDKAEKS